MIVSLPLLQSAVNFFMIDVSIFKCCSQIFELFHLLRGFITSLYVVILSCMMALDMIYKCSVYRRQRLFYEQFHSHQAQQIFFSMQSIRALGKGGTFLGLPDSQNGGLPFPKFTSRQGVTSRKTRNFVNALPLRSMKINREEGRRNGEKDRQNMKKK
jgi:hypothetical protein